MKSPEEHQKELQEIQEYIDTIATTAKLLDYEVSTYPSLATIMISEHSSLTPLMKLSLYATISTIRIKTDFQGKKTILKHESHQTKIDHLNKLLQAL